MEYSFSKGLIKELDTSATTIALRKVRTPRIVLKYICALLNTQKGGILRVGIDKDIHRGRINVQEFISSIQKALGGISPNPTEVVHLNKQCFCIPEREGETFFMIFIEESSLLYQITEPKSKFYVYNKNKIISFTDYSEAKRMSDYISSGLPYILDFEPSDTGQRARLRRIQEENNVSINSIGELPKGNYYYKYVDLETFLISLKTNKVRFNEPSKWADKYESRFYNADYSIIHAPLSDTPFLYAYCLTYSVESEAAWKIYSYQKQGIGAHCVELKIKRNEFREHLLKHLNDCKVFAGCVDYKDANDIKNLHYRNTIEDGAPVPSELYKTYFESFNLYKYLNLMLLKRKAFEHEKEVRFFIIPNDADTLSKSRYVNDKLEDNSEPKDTEIDWLDILDAIQIDKNCSKTECEILIERINSLIDARKDFSDEKKAELKKKLEPSPFDVYGIVENVKVGEERKSKEES